MRFKTLEDPTWRAISVLFAAFVLGCLVLPGPVSAAVTTRKLIWGPYDAKAFDTYDELGAGLYEFTINWARIAPTRPADPTDPDDPAYQWTPAVEEMIAHAQEHGIQVVLEVTGAPGWANGGRPWRWAPKHPQEYAEFVAAASKRWPQVHFWQIWGEPSRRQNFMPLAHVEGLNLTPAQRRGPEIYAQILDDSYGALKQVNPANVVIGGNTFSGGDIRPLAYIKALRLPDGKPPRMDMYGQNPFGYRRPDLSKGLINPTSGVADFCDLDVVARYLDKYLSRDGRDHRLPLFLSEYFLPTDPNYEFNYWVTPKTAANWLAAAFSIERHWHRIFTLGWFALEDDRPNGLGNQVDRGLLTYSGAKKPAYYAFKNG
ncbi:MAG: hypothetical protein WB507_06555 [Solirubrobacterales bacterium]